MSFGLKTHIFPGLFLTAIFLMVPLAFAQSLEENLDATKASFEHLWNVASEVAGKRSSLEAELATFDDRVNQAKKSIAEIAALRGELRLQLSADREKKAVLDQQLAVLGDAQAYYESLSVRLRFSLEDFARFVAEREIVADGGPATSSLLLSPFLAGSLGTQIDDALARDAILKARTKLLAQASVISAQSEDVRTTLLSMSEAYGLHMAALEKEQMKLGKEEHSAAEFVDQSWRLKTLTVEELAAVAAEAKESSELVAAMQADLIKINEELKQGKIAALVEQRTTAEAAMQALDEEIELLSRKDTAMRLLEESSLRALQETVKQRNTDRKIYQKIDVQELMQKNLLEERGVLSSKETIDENAIGVIDQKLLVIKEMLVLMRTGVPEDVAQDYVLKKMKAEQAAGERTRLASSLAELRQKRSLVERSLSTVAAAIGSIETQFRLDGLPPLFVWPVKGPLTALFHDLDYVRIFGVAHQAIDIAVPQGTPVKAISDGIVHTVRDGGATGYSYVTIVHAKGYTSLYGHVSKFVVSKGDIVKAGQVIALSGGRPGTPGAGSRTTGDHLHLEVRTEEGVAIDPKTVLP